MNFQLKSFIIPSLTVLFPIAAFLGPRLIPPEPTKQAVSFRSLPPKVLCQPQDPPPVSKLLPTSKWKQVNTYVLRRSFGLSFFNQFKSSRNRSACKLLNGTPPAFELFVLCASSCVYLGSLCFWTASFGGSPLFSFIQIIQI